MRTRAGMSPNAVGNLMRDFAAMVGLVALLAVIFVGTFGVA